MTVLWVDVSHHDWDRRGGQLDWPAVKAATSPVMCARATYGDPAGYSPSTRHFADFQTAARAAGFVLRGGYHNLIRGDDASMRRQVGWFRQQLDLYGCQWAMVDVERYAELVSNDLWPRWADVLRFRDAWYAVDSRPLVYYLPQWLVNNYYGQVDLTQLHGPLVQSHYAGGDGTAAQIYTAAGGDAGTGWDDRYGGRLPDIWQYTSGANVAGASSNTDVNAFRGSLAALATLLTGSETDMALTAQDLVAIWTHDLADGPSSDLAYRVLNRAAAASTAAAAGLVGLTSKVDGLVVTVETLAAALAGGGSDIDTAAVLARIDQRAAEDVARDTAQRAEVEQLQAEVDQLQAKLFAAAKAEADALGG